MSGHASMVAWDKTWRMHHMPMWAKKAVRMNAIKKGTWVAAGHYGMTTAESLLPNDLFDHWGSVERNGIRALVAQPYGNHDALAASFAAKMGWSVKSFTPGPWNDGTWCYEFLPFSKPASDSTAAAVASRPSASEIARSVSGAPSGLS